MRHRWNHNQETGLSTCIREGCGFIVKTYRVKHGGITPCKPKHTQQTLDEEMPQPPCHTTDQKPPQACYNCPGRLEKRKCDKMRAYHVANNQPPEE